MKRQFLFTMCVVLALAVTLCGTRPVSAQVMSASVPLEQLLNSDGTLDLERGFHGSLDPTGWQMVNSQNGEPRFVPASATGQITNSTRQLISVSGDENWDHRFGTPGPDSTVLAIAIVNPLWLGLNALNVNIINAPTGPGQTFHTYKY